ncbi:S9 family peptidase [Eudoraea adriatica]|uniref:S9 family peptidase n=1 Tax=Eudoraea adriatica TaxID=446681 RepID=UPI00036FFA96|nr:prolyl oligopeptidase family serine peptidase [Eudoraea adriatica]
MKIRIQLSIVLFLIVGHNSNLFSQTHPKDFDWDEFNRKATYLSDLQFSPDGNYILYATRNSDFDSNKWVVEHHVMNISNKKDSILKFEHKGVREINWSPSGKYLSYLANEDGKSQIFIQELPTGKVKVISNHSSNISRFYWSHDESKIAFIAKDTPIEKEENEKFISAFEVGPQGYLSDDQYLPSHLYLLDVKTQNEERLTQGKWTINSAVSWALNGEKLVFAKKADAYSSRWNDSEIMFYDLATKSLIPFSKNNKFEFNPEFTPKNNRMLYWYKTDKNPAGLTDLYIRNEDNTSVNLSLSLDRNIKSYVWLSSDEGILAYGQDGTKDGVWIISLDGKIRKASFSNSLVISSLTINKNGELVLIGSKGNQPLELFYLKDHSSAPIQLTQYNDTFKKMKLGSVETIEWKTDLNLTTDGVVTYPPNFSASKKYPLVLLIHGGPTASSMESFNPVAQEMAGNGWIVFQPNYRGSNNRGDSFQEAIMNDGGEGPGRDVMKGIEALKSRGYIDESKIAVSGWSYGGFMTSWLIGRYPDVWKVAVAGAAPIDFTDMTSLSNMNLTLRHAITNSPWVGDNYKDHYNMSPLKNLSKIKAPTLVMSKVEDQVVTVTGSYKLYHALLANNIPTKFIAYPGGGHFPSDPINRKDVYDRWISWLKEYLN